MFKLPDTRQNHYLTGMTALNIPSKQGHGDWHFREAFFGRGERRPVFFLAGEGERWDTHAILGDFGIYECSDLLRGLGVDIPFDQKVYAADHYRAVLDMVYLSIKKHQIPWHIEIDKWFDTDEQQEKLEVQLLKLKTHLSKTEQELLSTWLKRI